MNIHFSPLDSEEATKKILSCESVPELQTMLIKTERRIGQLSMAIAGADTEKQTVQYKADKRLSLALGELIKQRVKHLNNYGGRLDHNFRTIAKEVLDPAVYNDIFLKAKPKN